MEKYSAIVDTKSYLKTEKLTTAPWFDAHIK